MAEKRLNFTAEQIDELLSKTDELRTNDELDASLITKANIDGTSGNLYNSAEVKERLYANVTTIYSIGTKISMNGTASEDYDFWSPSLPQLANMKDSTFKITVSIVSGTITLGTDGAIPLTVKMCSTSGTEYIVHDLTTIDEFGVAFTGVYRSNTTPQLVLTVKNGNSYNNLVLEVSIQRICLAERKHTHAISDITNLQSALDNKSDVGHTHEELQTQPNLFNKDSSENVKGYYLDSSTGEPTVEDSAWMVTHYIAVTPNTRYMFDKLWSGAYVAFYDNDKTFISYLSTDEKQIVTPSNTAFIRAEVKLAEKDTATIKKHTPMSHIESDEMHLQQWQQSRFYEVSKIMEESNKLDVNSSEVTADKGFNNITDDTTYSSSSRSISPYISVDGGEEYVFFGDTSDNTVHFYDSSQTFISGISIGNNGNSTVKSKQNIIITPSNASYLRIDYHYSEKDNLYLGVNNILNHTRNEDMHINSYERSYWNGKASKDSMRYFLLGGNDASNQLSSGDDLNTFTTKQIYFSASGDITASLLNCPTNSNAGRLETIWLPDETHFMQRWTTLDGNEEWARTYNVSDGGWTAWNKTMKRSDFVTLTQAEYDALGTKDENTIYLITG